MASPLHFINQTAHQACVSFIQVRDLVSWSRNKMGEVLEVFGVLNRPFDHLIIKGLLEDFQKLVHFYADPSVSVYWSSLTRTPGDEMPKDRLKNIHAAQGVVGRVQWKNLGGHSYSGIFEGAQHGLAR